MNGIANASSRLDLWVGTLFRVSRRPRNELRSGERSYAANPQMKVRRGATKLICLGLAGFHVLIAVAFASDADGIAFFEQKIRPVLIEQCYSCHSEKAEKLRANLLLDSKAGWQKGGDSGLPAVVPGEPDQSPLIAGIQHIELVMPPGKPKLTELVIADLVAWVKMGAPDPRDGNIEAKRADKSWWSLQPIASSEANTTKFADGAIDSLIQAKLFEQGLTSSPPADARTIIRRMSYDLIGLPPTMEEVNAFAIAFELNANDATSNLAEKILSSPHYGEHWGRHWLDVVRFGESNGFERNVINDDIWPFRDYVIRSFNEDKPFNQFIVEHLAGDVVGKGNPEIEVGTAFLVAGPYDDVGNSDPVAAANIRAATLDDPITATSGAFLGLTINCARCHHHKFDPIPTEDYYRIRAAFEGVTHARRPIATLQQQQAFSDAMKPLNESKSKLNQNRNEIELGIVARAKQLLERSSRPKVDVVLTVETFPAVEARYLKFVMQASTGSPKSAVNSKLTEFQVWTADSATRNVALASNGTVATGARSTVAEDFPEAYGPQLVNDGVLGEQWFVGSPAVLQLNFTKPEVIDRISFSNDKGNQQTLDNSRGSTPTDYEILVSVDGVSWQTIASSSGREPWSEEHAIEQMRSKTITPEEMDAISKIDMALAEFDKQIRAVPKLQEMWVGKYEQPKEPTFVQKGGDPTKPMESIAPSGLAVLDHIMEPYLLDKNAEQGERRLALAKWITSDANPLTARVLANRVWQYHFGTGIVDTPSDFGFLGSRPSHPELLDYLARRLIENGWRLKDLHREILSSKAYLQASNAADENFAMGLKIDKTARFLWRFPPRRLNAEEVRDTLLKVSGKLDLKMGGPGFRLYKFTQNNVCTYFPLDKHEQETYRRSVYHQNARASVVDVLNDFDLPDNSFAAPKRANTTTPLQALTMLNHSFIQDMASSLIDQLDQNDKPTVRASTVSKAFEIAFQRAPSQTELHAARGLIQEHGFKAFARALLNSNELIFIE